MDQHFFNKTVLGLLLIGAGVLFLLNQMGVIAFDFGTFFSTYWPVILIYFGLKGIMIQRKLDYGWGGSYIWNGFLAVLGTYFLLRHLDISVMERLDLWQFIVPVLLILYGLSLMTRSPVQKSREERRQERWEQREERHRERFERREERRRRHGHAPSYYPGYKSQEKPVEPEPTFDPGFEKKIIEDFDQKFQERVGRKLADDPFPPAKLSNPEANGQKAEGEPGNAAVGGTETVKGEHSYGKWNRNDKEGWYSYGGDYRRTVNRSNFIGDTYLGQDYWELEPTNISHFIGDTVIDLTKANIPYGETRVIVSSFIGDVKVFVPNDIQVEVSVTASAFIGDMKVFERHEDGLFRHMKFNSPHYADAEKKIQLIISMFIGDVFVKRVG